MATAPVLLEGVIEMMWVPPSEAARMANIQREIEMLEAARRSRADALLLERGPEGIENDAELDKMAADIAEMEKLWIGIQVELQREYGGKKRAEVEQIIQLQEMMT
jgi:hypothetical protein